MEYTEEERKIIDAVIKLACIYENNQERLTSMRIKEYFYGD